MTVMTYGAHRIGRVVDYCCAMAQRLAAAIGAQPLLDLAAPVALNVVCFRYQPGNDTMQAAIAADLQEAGKVVLSLTTWRRRTVLRAAFVNHRTDEAEVDRVIPAVPAAGARYAADHALAAAD